MKIKICLVQHSPVFFDKVRTLGKVEELTKQYASEGCKLIVFPESYVPGYPRGFSFGAVIGSRTKEERQLYQEYYDNSIDVESKDLKRLESLARDQNVYLVIGITEEQSVSGSLFCSMLYIPPSNGLMGVHRKIKPAGTERLMWAEINTTTRVSCASIYRNSAARE
jgi:nitrilase